MIKKQLTEIKTTANPTSTLVTYNDHSIDKTTQNNNKELKKKNVKQNKN